MGFFGNISATISIAVTSDATVPDPQNADLTESEFSALTWQNIPNIVTGPETGGSTSFIEREIWGERLTGSFKGGVSGAESQLVLAISDSNTSNGRTALVTASQHASNAYAFRYQWPAPGSRVEYVRMLVGEKMLSKGNKEDPPEEMFDMKVVQLPIIT